MPIPTPDPSQVLGTNEELTQTCKLIRGQRPRVIRGFLRRIGLEQLQNQVF
jgi:hypothetical protein